ncbi:cytidylyltransferase domain-containing protein [Allopusillimonas ginsengisoli]|uniref:acylneuraminate cytidylyltransferase family protein n=1 Tax=Allopusillimonas ginsengisoli TaxID=453575 RepID=UPI00101FE1B8|nr:acylneuraminate cytidylyltransferase [Allopusillimonas ginsengisoli]TEA78018.1 acylneuraminate cytidylyltransferase [Allopusillimonas ginsengisoli]
MTVLAVITARAGSKGLKRKNLRKVGPYTLLQHAIRAAFESGVVDEVVVSTDGHEIACEAIRQGARVVWRPGLLASDTAKSIDVVCHALETVGIQDGECVLLQPTSPLRTARDVADAIELRRRADANSVVSVCPCEHHPYKTFIRHSHDKGLVPLDDLSAMEVPRQHLPAAYRVNGALYINKMSALLSARTFFVPKLEFFEMPVSRSLDIDTEQDLFIAHMLAGR